MSGVMSITRPFWDLGILLMSGLASRLAVFFFSSARRGRGFLFLSFSRVSLLFSPRFLLVFSLF